MTTREKILRDALDLLSELYAMRTPTRKDGNGDELTWALVDDDMIKDLQDRARLVLLTAVATEEYVPPKKLIARIRRAVKTELWGGQNNVPN